jgi:hypothetical protein
VAEWPTVEQFRRVLNFDPEYEDPSADTLASQLEAAIAKVKDDVGDWDEYTDVPDDQLSMAALRMAVLMALSPEAAAAASEDPTYQRHLFGHRRTFGIA